MSQMCRFVLTGDLLQLNETALPPFAQQLVIADQEVSADMFRIKIKGPDNPTCEVLCRPA